VSKPGPKPLVRRTCSAEGCTREADHPVSGLCRMHYSREKRTGRLSINSRSRGTGTITKFGYVAIAKNGKKKQAHVLVAESAIGKPLPAGAEVHHVNEIRSDNRNENLVICPSKAYHKLIHVRATALHECGNANYRKCPFCKRYDNPLAMKHNASSRYFYHTECRQQYRKEREA